MKFWLATTRKYRYDSIISEIKNYNMGFIIKSP